MKVSVYSNYAVKEVIDLPWEDNADETEFLTSNGFYQSDSYSIGREWGLYFRCFRSRTDARILASLELGEAVGEYFLFESLIDVLNFIQNYQATFLVGTLESLRETFVGEHEWHQRVRELKGITRDWHQREREQQAYYKSLRTRSTGS